MSRVFIKNLPVNATDASLRQHFSNYGNITDLKLVVKDGKFKGCAFIGFQAPDQASSACKSLNNTYINCNKITVEPARSLNDKSNKSRKTIKAEKDEAKQKREDAIKFKIQVSKLRNATDNKKHGLLNQYKNDPKFKQYLELAGSATKAGLSLEDWNQLQEKREAKKSKKEFKKKKTEAPQSDGEDEGIEVDENKLAQKEGLSDKDYWKSLTVDDGDDESAPTDSKGKQQKKQKEWKQLYTVRLRVQKMPKSVIQKKTGDGKVKKSRGLNKHNVKDFFKPVKCASVRKNTKNSFEFFIGFASEKDLKQALLKDRSFIEGVRVQLTNLSTNASDADASAVQHCKGTAPWAEAEARLRRTESVAESGKIYVRNLSYYTTEDDVKERFSKYGTIVDLDLPMCKLTQKIKGFATITFQDPKCAVVAMNELDGSDLMGRVMHILPALSDEQIEDQKSWMSSFKTQKDKEQKALAASWHNWNTLFLSSSAVADILAKKYHKTKEEILSIEGNTSAAVTMALAETEIVNETGKFLKDNGVSLDAFIDPAVERSNTIIIAKDLPVYTKASEITELFGRWGELGRVILPPTGTTAIIEFLNTSDAKKALKNLNYSRFGHKPLYLEKAPVQTFLEEYKKPAVEKVEENEDVQRAAKRKRDDNDEEEQKQTKNVRIETERVPEDHTTVYVQNLPLDITEEDIEKHFSTAGEVCTVVVAKKGDKSRGYCFVQYYKQKDARNALITLEGSTLGGRNLAVKLSEKKITAVSKTARQMHSYGKQTSSKIVVKNVAFQATKHDFDALFKPFGAIRRSFLAKHMSGQYNNGGYGFVEYVKETDAKKALEMMGLSTHFQGRRLVLEWAKNDESVEELREKTSEKRNIVESFGANHKKMRHAMKEMEERKSQQNDD